MSVQRDGGSPSGQLEADGLGSEMEGAGPLRDPRQLTHRGPSRVTQQGQVLPTGGGWEPPPDTPRHFQASTAERNPEARPFSLVSRPRPCDF